MVRDEACALTDREGGHEGEDDDGGGLHFGEAEGEDRCWVGEGEECLSAGVWRGRLE